MAPRYDEAPEAVPHNYPEVHHPPSAPETVTYSEAPTSPVGYFKPEHGTLYSGYPSSPAFSPNVAPSSTFGYNQASTYGHSTTPPPDTKQRRYPFGCQLIVFVLSVIIAILSVAVIGLAAGTGIASSRANQAESALASASAALAQATAPPDPLDFSKIDKGCSLHPGTVTGTTYTSTFFGLANFRISCNANAPNAPLIGLFVGNFDDCIDACASWSITVPKLSGNSTSNSTTVCAGVSFIPYWTNRTIATKGTAPGNCYLKPGPQASGDLESPNIGGQAVHAAQLIPK
ncbi:uncharacterized protein B0I36DRAFT_323834 [Microdochium trichocladiopsis]|uniref:Uncharacterized protein n=1 Tax=Microdochium trichocladiopsis TaxID=1682393 RepID=A0A9P8Y7P1_9PEZI|nr:uncharacterized protein B0I36DRAFT_323834 [Microdochium trichocladiopsis]KAH7031393.1 hypothetical protein B0I36DRAFT_323834 [Microdochium trichocladiopsis]